MRKMNDTEKLANEILGTADIFAKVSMYSFLAALTIVGAIMSYFLLAAALKWALLHWDRLIMMQAILTGYIILFMWRSK